jgi:hypothetical protein
VADFCKKCSIQIFGEDYGDMKGLCKEDECAAVLCEGCGFIYVDCNGEKIDIGENDNDKDNKQ